MVDNFKSLSIEFFNQVFKAQILFFVSIVGSTTFRVTSPTSFSENRPIQSESEISKKSIIIDPLSSPGHGPTGRVNPGFKTLLVWGIDDEPWWDCKEHHKLYRNWRHDFLFNLLKKQD